ncbi:MAG: D-inositol-3-phosphate glycosyltransferase [Phycisphaerae bacterium]|nr:D-inositol-3-phosphate glycosyltransferase [Phycisphaerae bacterium]
MVGQLPLANSDRPLRIALLAWESMHSIAVGGLAAHVSELAAALKRRGHDVHLFTRMGAGQNRYDCIEGVHYHRCPFDPNTNGDFLQYVNRMCDSFTWHLQDVENYLHRPFDIVHGHDWLSVPALVRSRNDFNHQVVFTLHSTEYGRCGNQMWGGQSEQVRHLEWEGAYVANQLICVSKALRQEVHSLYQVPLDKMWAIYNGVDVHKFDADINVASVRRRVGIGVDDPMILFAGRLAWQKGPDLLVEAMPRILNQHPRTKFIFAGDGSMRQGLEDRVAEIGAHESTRFLGHRNGLELISLFKTADAVCVPSRNEPFGIVILEAWSARKPVVTTRNGGPAEFVRHEDTGLTVSDHQDSIGWGIETVLNRIDSARQMGENGRVEAETRFSWDTIAVQTLKVYNTVLNQPYNTTTTVINGSVMETDQELQIMARSARNNNNPGKSTPKPSSTRSRSTTSAKTSTTRTARSTGKSATATNRTVKVVTEEMIRQRAHQIYLARNGTPGDPAQDWLQAERELRGV